MSDGIPHPRETYDWIGGAGAEEAFALAIDRGRLHHAWLLTGPAGVGKATFAYRAARRLLGAAANPQLGVLGSCRDDTASRLLAVRAHPDLLVIQREAEDGAARKNIPVEEARTLGEFFSKAPAIAAFRVAIVDAADDLNDFGLNALLKTLEEPPPRGILLLVCRFPGALTATVRSRCRRLAIEPGPRPETLAWLAERGIEEEEGTALLALAGGAPGRAWRLQAAGALALDATAKALVEALPERDESGLLALVDSFRGAAGGDRFALFLDRLAAAVETRARSLMGTGGAAAARPWAEAFPEIHQLVRETEAVNLDRADVFFTTVSRLQAIAQAGRC
ncbi:MAG TPA: DNA polymerase III subunit delta' [Caulobacteraceae bacterium]|nr:DNA polymerase III subunit delta' [Caulobacteraceae bacterium]